MEKIYVEVFVPGINKSYDMIVSPELKVKEAARYIFQTVNECEMMKLESKSPILCDARYKKICPGEVMLAQCGVHDGSKLILV